MTRDTIPLGSEDLEAIADRPAIFSTTDVPQSANAALHEPASQRPTRVAPPQEQRETVVSAPSENPALDQAAATLGEWIAGTSLDSPVLNERERALAASRVVTRFANELLSATRAGGQRPRAASKNEGDWHPIAALVYAQFGNEFPPELNVGEYVERLLLELRDRRLADPSPGTPADRRSDAVRLGDVIRERFSGDRAPGERTIDTAIRLLNGLPSQVEQDRATASTCDEIRTSTGLDHVARGIQRYREKLAEAVKPRG